MAKKEIENKKKPSDREKKYQKRLALEKKKLDKIINFPSKALFSVSMITGLLTFLYTYFGGSGELISAILTSFITFSICFIGIGFMLVLYFFFKSEQIKKDSEEKLLREKSARELDEQTRYKKELAELESIEKELYDKKNKSPKTKSSLGNDNQKTSGKASMSDEEAYLEEVLNSGFNKS